MYSYIKMYKLYKKCRFDTQNVAWFSQNIAYNRRTFMLDFGGKNNILSRTAVLVNWVL
eukprot:TRINITY_DN14222_c0_g1_i1.p1 TRINITY_DN14222_c0_g1~~TRINITY_DN14222_c0_g1_i1.p1  ORF type:complete len:58 (-),score=1.23 TRINITY_DN14222_c0_g1_i1:214-387(-)